jgi:fructokinase
VNSVGSRPADAASVVVIGDALIDELRDGTSSKVHVGGAALNVAVGLSILGVPTTLVAMVGRDSDGDAIRELLERWGVTLIATDGPLGSSRAISDRTDAEPSYSFNQAAQARSIDFDDTVRTAIDAAGLVVVSCFPFDNQEQSDQLEAAIQTPETRLVLDPNPRAGMLHDRELFVRNFERLAGASLLTKVGDEDAELLYDAPLATLRDRILAAGATAVLTTAGRDGAGVSTASGLGVTVPIADLPGAIVDTMGAGDATLAAVTHSIAVDGLPANVESWRNLLHDAMAIAAATCRFEGAQLRLPAELDGRRG